jgi:hypothetical protein
MVIYLEYNGTAVPLTTLTGNSTPGSQHDALGRTILCLKGTDRKACDMSGSSLSVFAVSSLFSLFPLIFLFSPFLLLWAVLSPNANAAFFLSWLSWLPRGTVGRARSSTYQQLTVGLSGSSSNMARKLSVTKSGPVRINRLEAVIWKARRDHAYSFSCSFSGGNAFPCFRWDFY